MLLPFFRQQLSPKTYCTTLHILQKDLAHVLARRHGDGHHRAQPASALPRRRPRRKQRAAVQRERWRRGGARAGERAGRQAHVVPDHAQLRPGAAARGPSGVCPSAHNGFWVLGKSHLLAR